MTRLCSMTDDTLLAPSTFATTACSGTSCHETATSAMHYPFTAALFCIMKRLLMLALLTRMFGPSTPLRAKLIPCHLVASILVLIMLWSLVMIILARNTLCSACRAHRVMWCCALALWTSCNSEMRLIVKNGGRRECCKDPTDRRTCATAFWWPVRPS